MSCIAGSPRSSVRSSSPIAVVAWRTQREHPTLVRLVARRGGPVRGPDRGRWSAGPDAPRRVDADAASRARSDHLGDARRADRDELLHGPCDRPDAAPAPAPASRTAGQASSPARLRPRPPTRSARTSRSPSPASSSSCWSRPFPRWSSRRATCPAPRAASIGSDGSGSSW